MSKLHKSMASDIFDLILPYWIIWYLDSSGPDILNKTASSLGMNRSELNEIIDQFLLDPQSVSNTSKVWPRVQPMFVKQDQEPTTDVSITQIRNLGVICFQLPLDETLTVDTPSARQTYFFDLFYSEYDTLSFDNLPKAADVEISFSPHEKLWLSGAPSGNNMANTYIYISNNGVFDSTKYPPCQNRFPSEHKCLENVKLETLMEICNCTPFNISLNNDTSLPPCTVAVYESCWTAAMTEAEKRQQESISSRTCAACLIPKNGYRISTRVESIDVSMASPPWYPRASIRFQCNERIYLSFEERAQFNFSQFVSQIGGDLGLYIGFSLVSVLQLLLFLSRSPKHQGTSRDSWSSGIRRWVQNFKRYLMQNVDQSVEMEILVKRMEEMANDHQVIMKKMIDLEKLLHQRNQIVKGDQTFVRM